MTTTPKPSVVFVCDGRLMPKGQDRLSSVAYQYTRKIGGDDVRRITTEQLRALLAELGVADPKAAPWKVKLPNGAVIECKLGTAPAAPEPSARKAPAAKKVAAAPRPAKAAKAKKSAAKKRASSAPQVTPIPKKRASSSTRAN